MSPRVVVLGDLMVDVVATASEPLARGSDAAATVRSHGGGSGANVAAWLAAAGAPAPLLLCCVGDDAAGRVALQELADGGVEVHAVLARELPTGTCVVVVEPDGERTFLPDRGANVALGPADLPADAFRPGDHLHLSAYALLGGGPARAAATEALSRARASAMTVSVDPASSAPLRGARAAALGWFAGAGTLLPNLDEARALTGEREPEAAARALAADAEVVLTLGPEGALWTDGTTVVRAVAGERIAGDSTGAGDAFAAGWLHARLDGAQVAEALAAANALGARAVAQAGGRP